MINFKVCSAVIAAMLLLTACSTVKMPASDNKALAVYEREIACVKSTDISAEKRYKAADVLFANLDFTYIRDCDSLDAVLGKGTKTGSYDGDRLQYTYSYGNKTITALFWYQGPRIVRSAVLYKDASKPMKASPKYLPESARGATEDTSVNANNIPVNPNKTGK